MTYIWGLRPAIVTVSSLVEGVGRVGRGSRRRKGRDSEDGWEEVKLGRLSAWPLSSTWSSKAPKLPHAVSWGFALRRWCRWRWGTPTSISGRLSTDGWCLRWGPHCRIAVEAHGRPWPAWTACEMVRYPGVDLQLRVLHLDSKKRFYVLYISCACGF